MLKLFARLMPVVVTLFVAAAQAAEPPEPDWLGSPQPNNPNALFAMKDSYEIVTVELDDWEKFTLGLPHFRLGNKNVLLHNTAQRIYVCQGASFAMGSTPVLLKEFYHHNYPLPDNKKANTIEGIARGGRIGWEMGPNFTPKLVWRRDPTLGGDVNYKITQPYQGDEAITGIDWSPDNVDYPLFPDEEPTSTIDMYNPEWWFMWGPGVDPAA